jgi:hypothetical protein
MMAVKVNTDRVGLGSGVALGVGVGDNSIVGSSVGLASWMGSLDTKGVSDSAGRTVAVCILVNGGVIVKRSD